MCARIKMHAFNFMGSKQFILGETASPPSSFIHPMLTKWIPLLQCIPIVGSNKHTPYRPPPPTLIYDQMNTPTHTFILLN
jgi:hypothetical protein